MNSFKDFKINSEETTGFIGEKIKAKKILNKQIIVHHYEMKPSKHTEGDCLYMQIIVDGEKRLLFSSSKVLMGMIQKVPKDKFPFTTTIIENNERHEFS